MEFEPIVMSLEERAFCRMMRDSEQALQRYLDDVARTVRDMCTKEQRLENTRTKMREIFSDPGMRKMLAIALTAADSTDEPEEEYRAEYPSDEDRAHTSRLRERYLTRVY